MCDFRITHQNIDGKSTSQTFSFSNDQGYHVLERKTKFMHPIFYLFSKMQLALLNGYKKILQLLLMRD
jgi:hypothetical protein